MNKTAYPSWGKLDSASRPHRRGIRMSERRVFPPNISPVCTCFSLVKNPKLHCIIVKYFGKK